MNKAYSKALKLLSRKSYSEKEIRQKLKSFPEEEIEEAINKLKNFDLINDRELAEKIKEKYLEKKKGLYYIINALRKKGIEEGIIRNIAENFNFDVEYKIAEQLVRERKKKNILLYLKGRGFSNQTIGRIMEKYGK